MRLSNLLMQVTRTRLVLSLSSLLWLAFGVSCGHSGSQSPILAKFSSAGGGDAHTAQEGDLMRWFEQHEIVRAEIEAMCEPKWKDKTLPAEWPSSDEGKVCLAAREAKRVKIQSDGVKF